MKAILLGVVQSDGSVAFIKDRIEDHEIETGMNLAALQYDLKLCREHGTYVDLETLAFAIHHVLQGDTKEFIKHLSAHARGKGD